MSRTGDARVSIIVATYDRPAYVQRQLDYWRDLPVEVIIVDGSPDGLIKEGTLISYPNARYFHYPSWYGKQLQIGFSEVRTPYAVLVDDDEFLLYPALAEGMQILAARNDVSAVVGGAIGYRCYRRRMVTKTLYEGNLALKIDDSAPQRRLEQRCADQASAIMYAVVSRELGQIAGAFVGESKYSCPYITEYQLEAAWCASGKVVAIPDIMLVRNLGNGPVLPPGLDRSLYLHDWCVDPLNSGSVAKLISSADRHFRQLWPRGGVSGADFVQMYGARSRKLCENAPRPTPGLMQYFMRSIPPPVRDGLRHVRKTMRWRPPADFLFFPDLLKKLDSAGMRYDSAALSRVKEFIETGECVKAHGTVHASLGSVDGTRI